MHARSLSIAWTAAWVSDLDMHAGLQCGGVEDVKVVEVLVAEGDGHEGRARGVDAPEDELRTHTGWRGQWATAAGKHRGEVGTALDAPQDELFGVIRSLGSNELIT